MAFGICSFGNHITNELHIIATLSQICCVSQVSVTIVFRRMCILVLQKTGCQKLKSVLISAFGILLEKNYFEGVNLTFIVWELKFLQLAFFQIKLLFVV